MLQCSLAPAQCPCRGRGAQPLCGCCAAPGASTIPPPLPRLTGHDRCRTGRGTSACHKRLRPCPGRAHRTPACSGSHEPSAVPFVDCASLLRAPPQAPHCSLWPPSRPFPLEQPGAQPSGPLRLCARFARCWARPPAPDLGQVRAVRRRLSAHARVRPARRPLAARPAFRLLARYAPFACCHAPHAHPSSSTEAPSEPQHKTHAVTPTALAWHQPHACTKLAPHAQHVRTHTHTHTHTHAASKRDRRARCRGKD
ncbi:MAG: hypothetical protein J3K34DRAFT_399778 [Monoraphidium minutum]|nr:MAG: hypothetical protein J3K34DRAFT_399778 [Monoraphidium minutum]